MSKLKECHMCGKPYYICYPENRLNAYNLNCYQCKVGIRVADDIVMSMQMVISLKEKISPENYYWVLYRYNANKPMLTMLSVNHGSEILLSADSKIYSLEDIKEFIDCMNRKISGLILLSWARNVQNVCLY